MWNIKHLGCMVLATLVVVGVLSCQKDSSQDDVTRYPILFDCQTNTTRANIVNDVSDIQSTGFRVYASGRVNEPDVNNFSFMKELRFTTDLGWVYDVKEYWLSNTTYHFIAFYPNDIDNLEIKSNGASAHNYTITDYNITPQNDLLMARDTRTVPAGAAAPDNGSVVDLQFNHLLSCVVLKVKSEIENVKITNVVLGDIAESGTCNDGTWVKGTTKATLSYAQNTTLTLDEEAVDISNGGFLVIPEYVDGSTQKITISTNANGVKKNYEVYIPEITWASGKRYTYTVTIKQNNIIFDEPSVVEWDEENATGSVIIK